MATDLADVGEVISKAMSGTFIVRCFCGLNCNFCVFLDFSIRFRMDSVPSTNGNIREDFPFCLLNSNSKLFCVCIREICVVIVIHRTKGSTMFTTIRANRTSKGSFNEDNGCKRVRLVFLFMFVYRFVRFHGNFRWYVPYFLTVYIAFSVGDRRNVISTSGTCPWYTLARCVPRLIIKQGFSSTFPRVVPRRRQRLTYRNYALVLMTYVRLFNGRFKRDVCAFRRCFFYFSFCNLFLT